MLKENDLFLGIISKVDTAIKRLKEFEPQGGYCLAFSGGKDSIVVKKLVEISGVKHKTYFNLTTIDPPELLGFVRQYHPDTIFVRPKYTMKQLIIKNKYPPTRIARYCCRYLKEGKDATGCNMGEFIITGVRWEESFKRSKRRMVEICMNDKTKKYIHPIIDWSENEVWEFIKQYKLPYCKLYDMGWKRIGCVGCPMGNQREQFEQYPKIKNMYLSAFKDMIKEREMRGLPKMKCGNNENEIMEWWISEKKDDEPDQTILFE